MTTSASPECLTPRVQVSSCPLSLQGPGLRRPQHLSWGLTVAGTGRNGTRLVFDVPATTKGRGSVGMQKVLVPRKAAGATGDPEAVPAPGVGSHRLVQESASRTQGHNRAGDMGLAKLQARGAAPAGDLRGKRS